MASRLGAALLVLALAAVGAWAQSAQTPSTPQQQQPAQAPGTVDAAGASTLVLPSLPENPYMRFEIVSLGAFPIMLFYTGFVFDLTLCIANGFDSYYAPWPFAGPSSYSANLPESDREKRILVALGGCAVVGAIDAVIHAKKVKRARLLEESGLSPVQAGQ